MASTTRKARGTRSTTSTRKTSSRSAGRVVRPKPFTIDHFRRWASFCILDNGKPWPVEDFQAEIVEEVFAGVEEVIVVIPQGNTKTTLLSGLAIYHCQYSVDAAIPIGASTRDQASIMYEQASGIIRRTPGLAKRFKVQGGYRRILNRADNGLIRVYAGDVDSGDGIIPGPLALLDEIHRHKDLGLYSTWRGKLGKRNAQIIGISTAGEDDANPIEQMRAAARKAPKVTRQGAKTIARRGKAFTMIEYSLRPEDDLKDVKLVKQANPFSGVTLKLLRSRLASPSMKPWDWARLTCNVPMQGEQSAVSPQDWARRAHPKVLIPAGTPIWAGLDLGWKWDTTAITQFWLKDLQHRIFGKPRIIVPPRDGTSLRPSLIQDAFREVHETWPIHTVVMDPNAGGEQLAEWIEDELGARVIAHTQDPTPMGIAAARFLEAIAQDVLFHPGDPEFTKHVLTAVAKVFGGDKFRFVPPTTGRTRPDAQDIRRVIDALISAAMVHSVAIADEGDDNPYETRGLLSF